MQARIDALPHKIDDGDYKAYRNYYPSQDNRLDPPGETPAERPSCKSADCHDKRCQPNNLTGKKEEDGSRDIDAERDALFQSIQTGKGIFEYKPDNG